MHDFIDELRDMKVGEGRYLDPQLMRDLYNAMCDSGRTIMLSTNPTCGRIVENGRVVHSFGPQDHFPPLEDDDA